MATRRGTTVAVSDDQTYDSEIEISTFKKNKRWTKYRFLAFWLTFISYALFHATRKTFSNVKTTISAVWTPQNTSLPGVFDDNWNGHQLFKDASDASYFLGLLDTVFMAFYAIGLFISGSVSDQLNLKTVLAFGMCSSSLSVFMFGMVSEMSHIYSKAWYLIFWAITGLLQSTGWPTVIAIIENWFGKSNRGFVMGLWGACPCVGNIVGTSSVAVVLKYGYQYSFLVTSSVTFAASFVIFSGLVPSPRDVGLSDPDDESDIVSSAEAKPLLQEERHSDPDDELYNAGFPEETQLPQEKSNSQNIERSSLERPEAIGLCKACCISGVVQYSLCYACLKFVNYSFFFWLPYYLQMAYGWNESFADKLSICYDVGGIIGGVFIGFLSDRLESRSPVVGLMLVLSPIVLYIYSEAPDNHLQNAVLMTLTGTVIGGVSSLISTAVSADLGKHPELSNSSKALSTVTGIIDGTGSIGAAIGQMFVPVVMKTFGWKSVFYLFIIMTIMTLLCILKIVIQDTLELCRRVFRRRTNPLLTTNTIINAEREFYDSS